jgi:hypothetical protein
LGRNKKGWVLMECEEGLFGGFGGFVGEEIEEPNEPDEPDGSEPIPFHYCRNSLETHESEKAKVSIMIFHEL